MEDTEELWWEYGMRVSVKLSKSAMKWSTLSEGECEAAALWKLEVEMGNGGFIQFFCNWGYEAYQYAIVALTKINAVQHCAVVMQSYSVIARFEEEELSQLWDIPLRLTEEEAKELESLDQHFWRCDSGESISRMAYEYYCRDRLVSSLSNNETNV